MDEVRETPEAVPGRLMEFLTPPWPHQLESFERAKDLSYFAFLYRPGRGKTKVAIDTCRYKYAHARRVLRTLIFTPPVVVDKWQEEWLKNSKLTSTEVRTLTGPGVERMRQFQKWGFSTTSIGVTGRVFITNYESLLMKDLYQRMFEWEPEIIILDESHRCKAHNTKRSKLMDGLCNPRNPKTKRLLPRPQVFLLTGTPLLNTPADMFFQWKLMDGGEAFGKYFTRFRDQYFRDRNAGMRQNSQRYFPKWELRTKEKDFFDGAGEIGFRAQKYSHVVQEDDPRLPPLILITLDTEMLPEQKKIYKEMKQEFVTWLEGEVVSASMALTKALRLMQIASGFVKTEEGNIKSLPETPKDAALKDLLEDFAPHHKIIVWAVFKENYSRIRKICDGLGLPYVELHGDVAEGQRQKNIDAFNTSAETRVLIGHPGSGGIGIDLIASDISIYYSRSFSLEFDIQSEARNRRGGSEIHKTITRYDLVCKGTIEELVLKRLRAKKEISESVLMEMKEEMRDAVTG